MPENDAIEVLLVTLPCIDRDQRNEADARCRACPNVRSRIDYAHLGLLADHECQVLMTSADKDGFTVGYGPTFDFVLRSDSLTYVQNRIAPHPAASAQTILEKSPTHHEAAHEGVSRPTAHEQIKREKPPAHHKLLPHTPARSRPLPWFRTASWLVREPRPGQSAHAQLAAARPTEHVQTDVLATGMASRLPVQGGSAPPSPSQATARAEDRLHADRHALILKFTHHDGKWRVESFVPSIHETPVKIHEGSRDSGRIGQRHVYTLTNGFDISIGDSFHLRWGGTFRIHKAQPATPSVPGDLVDAAQVKSISDMLRKQHVILVGPKSLRVSQTYAAIVERFKGETGCVIRNVPASHNPAQFQKLLLSGASILLTLDVRQKTKRDWRDIREALKNIEQSRKDVQPGSALQLLVIGYTPDEVRAFHAEYKDRRAHSSIIVGLFPRLSHTLLDEQAFGQHIRTMLDNLSPKTKYVLSVLHTLSTTDPAQSDRLKWRKAPKEYQDYELLQQFGVLERRGQWYHVVDDFIDTVGEIHQPGGAAPVSLSKSPQEIRDAFKKDNIFEHDNKNKRRFASLVGHSIEMLRAIKAANSMKQGEVERRLLPQLREDGVQAWIEAMNKAIGPCTLGREIIFKSGSDVGVLDDVDLEALKDEISLIIYGE